jgi:hypothetical protein
MKVRVVLLTLVAVGSAAGVACVLADPPPIVTPPPQSPPSIVAKSVTPSLFKTLQSAMPCAGGSGSDCFVVPVTIDPNASVKWRVFVDLDPTGSQGQDSIASGQDDGGVLGVTPDAGPNVRSFTFGIGPQTPIDLTQCHTFTFIVAYDFYPDDFSKPLPPGGDYAIWFYQPIANCNYYDGGPAFDASDGATE